MGWTPQQQTAISTPTGKGNILVSAAAGSGKTAVLVERVLQKIIGGASVDRLLIVTFTNAAAAEMREKIIKRLIKELDTTKSGSLAAHLKRQVQLAESADIMTIDAFCIRVVQNNFHILGADPNLGIADEALGELLRSEAVERLTSRLYKSEDSDERTRFSRLIDQYASNRSDDGLIKIITTIHDFITSFAEPEKWLDSAAAAYSLPLTEMPYAKHCISCSRNAAEGCIKAIADLRGSLGNAVDADAQYISDYADELHATAQEFLDADGWDEINAVYEKYFKNLSRKKKFTYTIQQQPQLETTEHAAELDSLIYLRTVFIERLKSGVTEKSTALEKKFANAPMLAQEAEDLAWLVKEFMRELTAVKDKRNVREFSDIEHMTFELFNSHEDIRAVYRDKYDEILIDEYQDTNGLQDSIFELISHKNIFMVGDLKQSIYRFRGGDPYIFKDKSRLYETDETSDIKITLAQNFRSRQEVLRGVNDVFSCVMSSEAGDVDYRGDELIVRDKERDYYPPAPNDCKAELHFLLTPPGTTTEQRTTEEVRFTVSKIKELLSSGIMVYDTDTQKLRPIRKKDIVILESSTKSNGDMLVRELGKLKIDAFCDTTSFFNRREIKVMMSLISIINNARQDIPLICVMRSPIGGFTDNELARIRLCAGRTDSFISAVRGCAKSSKRLVKRSMRCSYKLTMPQPRRHKGALTAKCAAFCAMLDRWRSYVRRMPVSQLIWTIYEESYFYDMMGAIEHGEEAQFNLRLLYERAKQYENAGFKGLFRFIEYIGNIENSNKDLGGAKMIGENHDVVRVMTIHKSKGLEFPYVFFLGTGSQLKTSEGTAAVKTHKDLLLGMQEINTEQRYMRETAAYNLIDVVNKQENKAERMRLAYVALTRAREKLYIINIQNNKMELSADEIISAHTDKLINGKMLPTDSLKAHSFADWICPPAFTCPDSWRYEFHNIIPSDVQDEETKTDTDNYENSAELQNAVFAILDYKYPYTEGETIPSRTSVTQLKELTIERESIDAPVYEPNSRRSSGADDMAELMFSPLHQKPSFMRETAEKPANEIGTLYHLVMSEADTARISAEGSGCIDDELQRLISKEKLSHEDIKYIDPDKIKGFYNSELGKRMLASKELRREEPFQIYISACDYDPSLNSGYKEEQVILQGIIDCFFEEDGGYVLIDYKTDKVRGSSNAIRERYKKQLELYSRAIEQLTDKPVREAYLYLFDTGETIQIKD